MKFNMFDDFRFIFPRKIDKYKNKQKSDININRIDNDYCLNSFFIKRGMVINFHQYLRHGFIELKDGVAVFNQNNHEETTKGLKAILYKKKKIFKQMQDYNNSVIVRNKKGGILSFSIRIKKEDGISVDEHKCISRKSIIRFFNNMRSKKFYSSDVIGYFWIVLRDDIGLPYIHVVLYFNNNNFNSLVGKDIIETWIKVVSFYKSDGEISFLNTTEDFTNGPGIYDFKNKDKILTIKKTTINQDWNSTDYSLIKLFHGYNKKTFSNYLYILAKKSYFTSAKGRTVGFSSIKD